tara:strand:+ start:42533 stop:42646 length:114 start_codon:yes stop_codon:yes gene_type:complete
MKIIDLKDFSKQELFGANITSYFAKEKAFELCLIAKQ